jgi:hypothetical protein
MYTQQFTFLQLRYIGLTVWDIFNIFRSSHAIYNLGGVMLFIQFQIHMVIFIM